MRLEIDDVFALVRRLGGGHVALEPVIVAGYFDRCPSSTQPNAI
jgi:hypothetical protein